MRGSGLGPDSLLLQERKDLFSQVELEGAWEKPGGLLLSQHCSSNIPLLHGRALCSWHSPEGAALGRRAPCQQTQHNVLPPRQQPQAQRHHTAHGAAIKPPSSPAGPVPRAYLLTYSDLERALELWPPRLTCFSIRCSMRSCISRFCKGREGRLVKGSWDANHLLGSRGLGSTAPLSLALGKVFPREMKSSPTKGGQGSCVRLENLEAHPCHLSSWYRQPDPLSA